MLNHKRLIEFDALVIVDVDQGYVEMGLPTDYLSKLNQLIEIFKKNKLPIYAAKRPENEPDTALAFDTKGIKVYEFKDDGTYSLPTKLLKNLDDDIETLVVGCNVFPSLFSLSETTIRFMLCKELCHYITDAEPPATLLRYYLGEDREISFDDVLSLPFFDNQVR